MIIRKVLRIESLKPYKISVNCICYSGVSLPINDNLLIELVHAPEGIRMTVNGLLHLKVWKVYEQTIKHLTLNHNGYCPYDKASVYYAISNGKRYRSSLCRA